MRSVKLISKKKATRKDGTAPIYIQYSYNREKRILLNTGKRIAPELWNPDLGQVRRKHPRAKEINEYCLRLKQRVESIVDTALLNQVDPTFEYVKERFEAQVVLQASEKTDDFWRHWNSFIESAEGRVTPGVIQQYQAMAKHLQIFEKLHSYPISFDSLDYTFYEQFRKYLIYEAKKPDGTVGMTINTVGKQFKNLKVFLHNCIKKGIIPHRDLSAFKSETEEVDHIYLTETEIRMIWKLDLTQEPALDRIRDLMIIGCETGLRFSDFSKLKPGHIQDKFIRIRTRKTNKSVVIPISTLLREVLDKYDNQPPTTYLQEFNEQVKVIGELAGLDEEVIVTHKRGTEIHEETFKKYELISSHTCRRSFCTNQFYKGMPTLLIRKISGHKTESAFLRYIKIDEEAAAMRLLELWDKSTDGSVN